VNEHSIAVNPSLTGAFQIVADRPGPENDPNYAALLQSIGTLREEVQATGAVIQKIESASKFKQGQQRRDFQAAYGSPGNGLFLKIILTTPFPMGDACWRSVTAHLVKTLVLFRRSSSAL
jgi:hypothetical protein